MALWVELPLRGEDGKVWNRRIFPVAERRGQSRLTEPLADAQFQQRERVFVPLKRPCRLDVGMAQGGLWPFRGQRLRRIPAPRPAAVRVPHVSGLK
jgi:hypothetical protein